MTKKKKSSLTKALKNHQQQQQQQHPLRSKFQEHQQLKPSSIKHPTSLTSTTTITTTTTTSNRLNKNSHHPNKLGTLFHPHQDPLRQNLKSSPSSSSTSSDNQPPPRLQSHHRPSTTPPLVSILGKRDRVLLVGEGNFSFSVSLLIEHGHPGKLMTATTVDREEVVMEKYPESVGLIRRLKEGGVRVMYGIDGCRLEDDKRIKSILDHQGPFDRVIFNFPHVGGSESHQDRIVRANQILILRFLRSSAKVLFHPSPPSHHPHPYNERPRAQLKRSSSKPTTRKKKLKKTNYPPLDLSDSDSSSSSHTDDDQQPSDSDHDHDDEHHLAPPRTRKPGTVLITTGTDPPYSLWNVPMLAKNGRVLAHTILYPSHPNLRTTKGGGDQPNFRLIRSFDFDRLIIPPPLHPGGHHQHQQQEEGQDYHGSVYQHRQTNGCRNILKNTKPSHPRTWEFEPIIVGLP